MGRRIKIQLKGANRDQQHVRFSDFINQLQALRLALENTERIISGIEQPSVYYRVIDLTHTSPATVVLEAHTLSPGQDLSQDVVRKFFGGLRQIKETGQISPDYDHFLLESYKALGSTLKKNVTEILLSDDEYQLEITRQFETSIDRLIGPDQIMEGPIDGMLDAINVHNKANKFYIYPALGPSKVTCHFPESMLHDAIAAIQRHVQVTGHLKYKQRDFFPHEVEVFQMEVYPPEDQLPTLESLRGIAPNATGGMDSVAFVRAKRDAER